MYLKYDARGDVVWIYLAHDWAQRRFFLNGSGLWGSHKEGDLLTSCVMVSYNNNE